MASASVSGLSSGIDTASIVEQLMQIEAIPQNKLKTQVSKRESVVSALQGINTSTAGIATQAKELAKASSWSALTTSSSLAGVTATATSSASPASFDVKVQAVATSHSETYASTAALTDALVPEVDGKRMLTITQADGTQVSVDTGDGTLKGVADALNNPANGTGVKATLIQVSAGNYRLVVDATATGTDSSFSIATVDGSPDGGALLGGIDASRTRAGTDAEIVVSGFTLTSKTNTFNDIMPGISLTLASNTKVGETATLDVTRDASQTSEQVKLLVDNINSVISTITTRTAYAAGTGTSGILSGDSTVRALRSAFADTLYAADGSIMADMGLSIDRYGKLTFDEAAFAKAYETDPEKVAAAFATGNDSFAGRVEKLTKQYSDPTDGILTQAVTGHQSTIKQLNQSIEGWDLRLETRRSTLSRQYTAMETMLTQLQGQGNYISSQISSWNASKN